MDQDKIDTKRGEVAWWMLTIDVLVGHYALGFDYPMNGDAKPRRMK